MSSTRPILLLVDICNYHRRAVPDTARAGSEITFLGQIVGATSVVVSFIFLVRRISQNTAMMRMGSASDRLQREFDIALPMIHNS
jgi:hypothetical protein